MANGLLEATVHGNLVKDATSRATQSGQLILNARLAVDRRVKKGDKWEDQVEYVDLVSFDEGRIPGLKKLLTKGRSVLVKGRPTARAFERQDKTIQANLSVIISQCVLTHTPQGKQAEELPPPPDDDDVVTDEA